MNSKFDISWLILLFCVINLEIVVCYNCEFEYESDLNEDYEEYDSYICSIKPDSRISS